MSTTSKPATATAGSSGSTSTPYKPAQVGVGLKTDAVAEQQMRQAIRDLVASADPFARLDMEAEDMLLTIASEFVESTTNFSARLARHRGSDTLDVKDLQLHLERHHHIRVPGFASTDDLGKVPAFPGQPVTATAQPSTNTSTATGQPAAPAGTGTGAAKGKEKASNVPPTIRSKRLAAVKQATK